MKIFFRAFANPETTAEDKVQLQRQLNERKAVEMVELVSWWTQRMYNTPSPLTEIMMSTPNYQVC
jgi:hypothetical protein